jgi:metal-responsive CopG/Arc/MetJ family transcriptional regulator
MAMRKVTFTLPDQLADQFVKRVPARDRSRYVAEALSKKLAKRERRLIRACKIANNNPDIASLEQDLDTLQDETREPWTHAPAPDRLR